MAITTSDPLALGDPSNYASTSSAPYPRLDEQPSVLGLEERPPTLSFPTLHLGSFHNLSADNFPSPPSPAKLSPASTLTSPRNPPANEPWSHTQASQASASHDIRLSASHAGRASGEIDRAAALRSPSAASGSLRPGRSRESSRSSIRSRASIPPPLPPPNMTLPPLPLVSPISPIGPSSPLGGGAASVRSSQSLSPVNPSLRIHIPPPVPVLGQGSTAVLKQSPGIPRRRTLVEQDKRDHVAHATASPQVMVAERQASLDMPRRSTDSPSSMHRLEKKASMSNLKAGSPTARRSLPRPPSDRPSLDVPRSKPVTPAISIPAFSQPRASSEIQPGGQQARGRPSTGGTNGRPHQQSKSASTLPVIPGLSEAGPYPSSNPGSLRGQPTGAGPSNRASGPRPPPQEEICLECMMRDRDLADVIVSGDGVWERASDAAWDEFRQREEFISRSSAQATALEDHSSEESVSPPSTNHSLEDGRQAAARKKRRAVKRARRKELDQRIVKEVGWRGFKWEEGSAGEGLPRSFRGGRGGPLTEEGIKAVMAKFPSASAHRYNSLQTFLRHQYALILEIAAEAKRLGYFPTPVEIVFSSTTSHEGYMPVATSSRTSSLTWDSTPIMRLSSDQPRPAPTSVLPPPSTPLGVVRQSPSSPADLSGIANGKPFPHTPSTLNRPHTQFIPDREPVPGMGMSPASLTQGQGRPVTQIPAQHAQIHARTPLQLNTGAARALPGQQGAADDDDLWLSQSPADSGIRPFSFAVRAGAVREGSEGHGRRSIFGRWGGSVTSLFGGSQGGSGSMVDMHLGLDSDRRHNTSSQYVHSAPRAVSLASPTRPSFFSRDSRSSSADRGLDRERDRIERATKSMSNSRLSQSFRTGSDDDDEVDRRKSRGLKGLLRKMKPKSSRKGPTEQAFTPPQYDNGAQLAPPPSLNFLAGQGKHHRNRSESSSSILTDNERLGPGVGSGMGAGGQGLPAGMRTVSAPLAGSSSGGSQNASPTSSRYYERYPIPGSTPGAQRGSYASLGRRGSNFTDDPPRNSMVDVLNGQLHQLSIPDNHTNTAGNTASYQPAQAHSFRPHNKTTSSLSASSVVETPPASHVGTMGAYFPAGHAAKRGSMSPNRFKNLPPLPPPGSEGEGSADQTIVPDDLAPAVHPAATGVTPAQPTYYPVDTVTEPPRMSLDQRGALPPRASFDPSSTRAGEEWAYQADRRGEAFNPPRMAQSMYAQPTLAGSTRSFGSYPYHPAAGGDANAQWNPNWGPQRAYAGYPAPSAGGYDKAAGGGGYASDHIVDVSYAVGDASVGKGSKGRKGLKGLFGAKGGRLA